MPLAFCRLGAGVEPLILENCEASVCATFARSSFPISGRLSGNSDAFVIRASTSLWVKAENTALAYSLAPWLLGTFPAFIRSRRLFRCSRNAVASFDAPYPSAFVMISTSLGSAFSRVAISAIARSVAVGSTPSLSMRASVAFLAFSS